MGLNKIYRFVKSNLLKTRSICKTVVPNDYPITNLYYATIQKTGSQWLKRIFSDERIKKHTGLAVYPQYEYEYGDFHTIFPKYTFVPGLYIPYQLYEEIKKPQQYKTFYVIRDPRNIVVSWYYSMLNSHRPINNKVVKYRKKLNSMDYENGLKYCIRKQSLKFSFMRSWVYSSDDPNVLIIKFEDLINNNFRELKKIFNHCGFDIPDSCLREVLEDYTKDKMREKNLARRRDSKSHYRKKSSDWRKAFSDSHKKLFYQTTGDLVDILGYKR